MKLKKRLGQHLLKDQNIAKKISELLPAAPGEPVVEIGPGLGALTQFLIEKFPGLMVIEYDPEAVAELKSRFDAKGLHIFETDFLEWEPDEHLQAQAWFIGNLPYNISSQIFFRLLDYNEFVKGGVFMVQLEVAQRIASGPGSKEYGILSVLMGYFFEIKFGFKVPPQVFQPPPKVQSAVFSIRKREGVDEVIYNSLRIVVKKAFNQRRKTLRNALKGLNFTQDFGALLDLRAEQLSIREFEMLARSLVFE